MRDDFPKNVKSKLAARVGYHCSICDIRTSGPGDDGNTLNTGIAAHIRAAATGGPRYDSNQTASERASIDNGIWLCIRCSKVVDTDVSSYSVEALLELKNKAEERARSIQLGHTYLDGHPSIPRLKGMRLKHVQLTPSGASQTLFELTLSNVENTPINWFSLLVVFFKESPLRLETKIARTSYQILNDSSPIDKDYPTTLSFNVNGLELLDMHQMTIVVWCKYTHVSSLIPVYFDEVSTLEISNRVLKRYIQSGTSREKFLDLVRQQKSLNIAEIENSSPPA